MSKRCRGNVFLSTFLMFVFLSLQFLQAQAPNGSLRGEVQDASGRRVAGAKITVTAKEFGSQREVLSDEAGQFRVNDLVPGAYRVLSSAPGFAQASTEVNVVISVVRDLSVVLKPETVRESVNVESHGSSITTEPIDTASTVQQGFQCLLSHTCRVGISECDLHLQNDTA